MGWYLPVGSAGGIPSGEIGLASLQEGPTGHSGTQAECCVQMGTDESHFCKPRSPGTAASWDRASLTALLTPRCRTSGLRS